MNVQELINELQKFPANTPVAAISSGIGFSQHVKVSTLNLLPAGSLFVPTDTREDTLQVLVLLPAN